MQQRQQQQQALTASVRDINRRHIEVRAGLVLQYIGEVLRQSGIKGKFRVQMTPKGKPMVLILVQGIGAVEAYLTLPNSIDGFTIKVV